MFCFEKLSAQIFVCACDTTRITLLKIASDSDYSYTFLRSVVCLSVQFSSVCLSHSCRLLKPF